MLGGRTLSNRFVGWDIVIRSSLELYASFQPSTPPASYLCATAPARLRTYDEGVHRDSCRAAALGKLLFSVVTARRYAREANGEYTAATRPLTRRLNGAAVPFDQKSREIQPHAYPAGCRAIRRLLRLHVKIEDRFALIRR